MHGLDDKPSSWQESAEWLAGKIGPNVKAVCPAAPLRAITKSKGEIMTGWCDVHADWPFIPASKDDTDGLAQSVAAIHKEFDKLVESGVPSNKIIVGGFSQGAAVATLAAYTYGKPVAGCLNLSGWLPNRDAFAGALKAENKKTPIFWGHGTKDEVLPLENQTVGAEVLTKQGIEVTANQYDFGHDTNEAEFYEVLKFIQKQLQ